MPRHSKGARLWLQPARRDQHGRIIEQTVWVIRDGKTIAAALLGPGPDGRVFAEVRPEILTSGRPAAFAISVEQKGGVTDSPKGPVILTGAVAPP